jgi:predicted amino acid-binding ACT domain protein
MSEGRRLKLWDFERMENGRIRIGKKIGEPLGLVDGSEVFSSMFKYEINGRSSYEIVLSPFGPENYREIAYLTFQVRDEPGALAQAAQFLKSRNVDILNSETVSSIPQVEMVWEMLADLSFFGDSASLKKEFEDAKRAKDPSLSLVDFIGVSASDLATRYTRGAVVENEKVKTKALRKTEKKASIIKDGVFEMPQAYLNFLGRNAAPIMLIGEPDSWILSIAFLEDESKLMRLCVDLPDRPGAVYEIMKTLGEEGINVLAGYTNVLVYYERMTCELVIDIRASAAKVKVDLVEILRKRIAGLGPSFCLASAESVRL